MFSYVNVKNFEGLTEIRRNWKGLPVNGSPSVLPETV
jgi:hypothetical protein